MDSDKGPATAKGRFNFMRGTGKFKGIKGGGTYEGNVDADDVLTLKLEGVYEPAAMAGGNQEITEEEQSDDQERHGNGDPDFALSGTARVR